MTELDKFYNRVWNWLQWVWQIWFEVVQLTTNGYRYYFYNRNKFVFSLIYSLFVSEFVNRITNCDALHSQSIFYRTVINSIMSNIVQNKVFFPFMWCNLINIIIFWMSAKFRRIFITNAHIGAFELAKKKSR